MAGLVFKQPRRGWIKRQPKNQTTLTAASLPSLSQEMAHIPTVLPESTYDFLDKANRFTLTKSTYKAFMKASLNMMKMASWLNYKRFQTKMNSKSQSSWNVVVYFTSYWVSTTQPCGEKMKKLLSLTIKGFRQALPYGVQMAKGLISS